MITAWIALYIVTAIALLPAAIEDTAHFPRARQWKAAIKLALAWPVALFGLCCHFVLWAKKRIR